MKNNKRYWMKRRRYGWGWTPTTWQGWLFIFLQLGTILLAALQLPLKPAQPTTAQFVSFLLLVAFVIISLFLVSSFAAPKPRWRWGRKDSDNSDEDF